MAGSDGLQRSRDAESARGLCVPSDFFCTNLRFLNKGKINHDVVCLILCNLATAVYCLSQQRRYLPDPTSDCSESHISKLSRQVYPSIDNCESWQLDNLILLRELRAGWRRSPAGTKPASK